MILRRGNTKHRRIAAVGMYDGVHRGHRFLLDYVRLEGQARGLRPAAVTFERHPRALVDPAGAPKTIQTPPSKYAMLARAGADDVIVLDFDDTMRHMSAEAFLKMLKRRWAIDTLVLGFNNRFGHDRPSGIDRYREIGSKVGVEVIAAPEYRGPHGAVSSSVIRRAVEQGRLEDAREMLGRPFALTGTVVAGQRVGRTIGFPTANVAPLGGTAALIPPGGVYSAIAILGRGKRYPAVVNIGRRPTVDTRDNAPLSIEAHLIGFQGNLYGSPIVLSFGRKLRDEKRFDGLAQLKDAIANDVRRVAREAAGHLDDPEVADGAKELDIKF